MPPSPADPLLGAVVGSYRVERRLGEGGMGAVYQLVHPTIGKRLALKVLHPEYAARPDIVQRFFDEARAVNLIRHPGIVDVLDLGHLADGRPCLTMELLDGESLADHLARRGPLPPGDVTGIARQLTSALAAAHRAGVVHRDLKPDNVFLVPGPDGAAVKVLDFGIAKLDRRGGAATGEATRTGAIMGTPAYMAPEQALGRVGDIDARTDVYAVGAMIFEMLSGAPPFRAESLAALVTHHASGVPLTLAAVRPDLPAGWTSLVDRAIAPRRAARFATMEELGAALAGVAGRGGPPPGARRWRTPLRLAIVAATGLAFAATALVRRDRGELGRSAAGVEPRRAGPAARPPGGEAAPLAPASVAGPAREAAGSTPASTGSATADRRAAPATSASPPRTVAPQGAGQRGALRVTASPWADVRVDGVARGPTPITLELTPGPHAVVLSHGELGQRVERHVKVRAGHTTPVAARFD